MNHLTAGKGDKTASETFLNGFSFKARRVHFPRFSCFFFFFLSIEKMVSLLAGCLQGTIYSNGKRLHLELNSAQHWPIHPTGMRSVKWESHFSFGLRLLSCCCSLCFVVCYRDSLIRTAVYESFFFLAPAVQWRPLSAYLAAMKQSI